LGKIMFGLERYKRQFVVDKHIDRKETGKRKSMMKQRSKGGIFHGNKVFFLLNFTVRSGERGEEQ